METQAQIWLNVAGAVAEQRRVELRTARRSAVLAVAVFTGRSASENGWNWMRICHDCKSVQPEQNTVNQPCACGCNVVLWEPQS